MTTINTCGETKYSPLIPAVAAICTAKPGECIKIIMDDVDAFGDLKTYLSEQHIGFREIYDGDRMTLEFTIS
ncbi:sulfurtransferase TusA family protein [uncultured Bacteroides sp.]|uniref:sulfurtransferase TusA family protein n=1 Tax=uncultured Bacteroides sp. TaxID=162156 RepID=UPI002AA5E6BD|nr:sulfurtransferase TusA family protein [uncultured Bacteroides sp.]